MYYSVCTYAKTSKKKNYSLTSFNMKLKLRIKVKFDP